MRFPVLVLSVFMFVSACATTQASRPQQAAAAALEDPACPYVFSEADAQTFATILTAASTGKGAGEACRFADVSVSYTRAIATWTSGRQTLTATFQAAACESGSASGSLTVIDDETLRQGCPSVHAAALAAMADGRMPVPSKRAHTPTPATPVR